MLTYEWEKSWSMLMTTICQTSHMGIVMDSGLVTSIVTNGFINHNGTLQNFPATIKMGK